MTMQCNDEIVIGSYGENYSGSGGNDINKQENNDGDNEYYCNLQSWWVIVMVATTIMRAFESITNR